MMRPTVRDVMTADVVTLSTDATFKEIARTLATRRISGLPVVHTDGTVVGVVSEADLLPKEEVKDITGDGFDRSDPADRSDGFDGSDGSGRSGRSGPLSRVVKMAAQSKARGDTAADLMSMPVVTIAPDAPVAEAARTLAEHGIKRLPVVDSDGRLVGIVARADVLKVFLKSDKEIADLVVEEVVKRCLWEDPEYVTVEVEGGIVTLGGRLGLKSLIPIAVRLTAAIDGVVDVVDELTYDRDDTAPRYQRY